MSTFISDYISYFQNLASKHVDILHTKDEKHFFRMESAEIINGMTNDIRWPAMVLEAYDISYNSRQSNNILKSHNGSFMILMKPDNEQDFDSIQTIWEKCEKIGSDIIVRMYNDRFDVVEPVVKFDMNSVVAVPVATDIEGSYGYRFSFSLINRQAHNNDATKWSDL